MKELLSDNSQDIKSEQAGSKRSEFNANNLFL